MPILQFGESVYEFGETIYEFGASDNMLIQVNLNPRGVLADWNGVTFANTGTTPTEKVAAGSVVDSDLNVVPGTSIWITNDGDGNSTSGPSSWPTAGRTDSYPAPQTTEGIWVTKADPVVMEIRDLPSGIWEITGYSSRDDLTARETDYTVLADGGDTFTGTQITTPMTGNTQEDSEVSGEVTLTDAGLITFTAQGFDAIDGGGLSLITLERTGDAPSGASQGMKNFRGMRNSSLTPNYKTRGAQGGASGGGGKHRSPFVKVR